MAEKHKRAPIVLSSKYSYVGQPPSSLRVGKPAVESYQYMRNWVQGQQIFTYSAAEYGDGDSTTLPGTFYVILHTAPKIDTDYPTRQLGGLLIPWSCEPDALGGSVTTPVRIKWQQNGLSAHTLVSCNKWILSNQAPHGWDLGSTSSASFNYVPEASGLWTWGKLTTENIRTAALSIWTMPDWEQTDTQAYIRTKRVEIGSPIQGYTLSSLGGLIHRSVREGSAGWDDDTIERNATRCLFQWGHPIGVWHDNNSYTELGTVGTTYKIKVPAYYSYASNRLAVYPTVVASATNASGGDPAYVKISSMTGADTWELPITSDAVALYDYTDASDDTLSVRTDAEEEIKIEIKAPNAGGAGEVILHTVALWCHAF